jgi:hypothetical protein
MIVGYNVSFGIFCVFECQIIEPVRFTIAEVVTEIIYLSSLWRTRQRSL